VAVGRISVWVGKGSRVNADGTFGWEESSFPLTFSGIGVLEGVAVGVLRTVLAKKVGVMLGVAVKKKWANGFNIAPSFAPPVGVAPVFGMKRSELIISRSFESPPVKSIGTVNPKIQIISIPAVMIYTV